MARFHQGPIETVRDAVVARRFVWRICFQCGQASWSDPRDLAFRYGALTFRQLADHSRCLKCQTLGRAGVIADDLPWADR